MQSSAGAKHRYLEYTSKQKKKKRRPLPPPPKKKEFQNLAQTTTVAKELTIYHSPDQQPLELPYYICTPNLPPKKQQTNQEEEEAQIRTWWELDNHLEVSEPF